MDYSWVLPAFFATGLAAGFVDSIAGGGGLLTLPVFLSVGLPPQDALATNKLQAIFGSASASWHYGKAGLIDFSAARLAVAFTVIGALAGTVLVLFVSQEWLRRCIPFLLAAVALYVLFRPTFGESDHEPRMPLSTFSILFGLSLGFYDGFFGPGTGSLWALVYTAYMGFNLTRATAHTKLVNFASNVGSLAVFLFSGKIWFLAGITMGFGQLLGARLGSHAVIKRGTRIIRPVFILVVLAITAKLIWENFRS